jgi:hypothetical protein
LSFAERLKLKTNSGFDSGVRDKILELKERKVDLQKQKSDYKPGPKMPKQQFSKLPVSVIKHIKGQVNENKRVVGRDPRFQNASGSLN